MIAIPAEHRAGHLSWLRSIAAAPEDDLPRLAFADWLTDHGEPEYGEFIRVQCELAARYECDFSRKSIDTCFDRRTGLDDVLRTGCHLCRKRVPRVATLRSAELAWVEAARKPWRAMYGLDIWLHRYAAGVSHATRNLACAALFRRGFVSAVRGPLARLLGICDNCDGAGESFGANHGIGFRCTYCAGSGRTPGALAGLGAELLTVERVEVSDREPEPFDGGVIWSREMRDIDPDWEHLEDERTILPGGLFDAMEGEGYAYFFRLGKHGCNRYPTEAAARDALSAGILRLARRAAGLEA